MYFVSEDTAVNDMGHWFSRLEIESELLDGLTRSYEVIGSPTPKRPMNYLDHEIAQLTKLRSGAHENYSRAVPGKRENLVSVVKMLAGREANLTRRGKFSMADRCHILSDYLPVNGPWVVDQMSTRAYVSQFSADGTLFIAAFQGSHIRIYNVENRWKVQKNILAKSLRWTVTDTSLSPDQRYLVYATMSPVVHIVNIGNTATESLANITEIHDGLDFSGTDSVEYSFGIFSLKFSTDGRELVAGSSDDAIYVYDLEANKLSLRIAAHTSRTIEMFITGRGKEDYLFGDVVIPASTYSKFRVWRSKNSMIMSWLIRSMISDSDVNTVCFADESGHLIYSGGDDNLCKVWDRRCFRAKGKPAGVLIGHLEGVTFLDSRGDGRYFISNGKDQAIKLWDIRKMSSKVPRDRGYRNYDWDYRWMEYPPQARELKHPGDQSVATYRGHSVLRTLIRCYFSPAHTTGQKYIYTGSHDSSVYIYDLVTGGQVAKLQYHSSAVRDCSWHPNYPMLVSSSWDGDIVKWEFRGNEEGGDSSNKQHFRRRHFN